MAPPGANRRGIIALFTATFFFTVNDAIMKIVIRTLPFGEGVFVRGALTAIFLMIALIAMGQFRQLPRSVNPGIAGRSFFDACATVFFVTALVRMHLADLISIILASPLILTAMSVIFLKEKVGWRRWTAIAVGFAGTLFIVKPVPGTLDIWALLGLASACASAARDLLTQRIDPKIPTLAVGVAAGTAIMIAGAFVGLGEQWRVTTPYETALLVTSAAFYSVGCYLLVVSFRGVDLSIVSPFRYGLLFWALIIGYILLGEVPDIWSLVGAIIIVGSGIYTLHRETVRHRNLTGNIPPQ